MTAADKRAALSSRIRARQLTTVPGVFDMVSARVADQAGFDALYMTGYGIAASQLGVADAGLASYADMVDRVRTIADGTKAPLIADADTGFGGLLNVAHTVRGYEAAGAAAVQIEDQEFPKKCGHAKGRTVIPAAEMVTKVEVAVDAREHDDFLIVARTDARSSLGLDDAIARGQAYAAAGADVIFVESPESEDEFARIATEIDAPVLANMVEGGFSPQLSAQRLGELGFTIALFPVTGLLAAADALAKAYGQLHATGTSDDTMSIANTHTLMGFEQVWEFDARWAPGPNETD